MPLNRQIFNAALYKRIRDVWFADLPREASAPPEHIEQKRWFPRDITDRTTFDGVCKEEFGSALTEIGPSKDKGVVAKDLVNEIESEKEQQNCTETALSIVLLLDQIPRNNFREKDTLPYIYSHYDFIARDVVRHVLSRSARCDHDPMLRYSCARRMWFYLPLMHSEERSDHERLVALLQEMTEDMKSKNDEEGLTYMKKLSGFEGKHKEIVDQFGRYPYRNAVMGRTSTKEEEEWLKDGESFGVEG